MRHLSGALVAVLCLTAAPSAEARAQRQLPVSRDSLAGHWRIVHHVAETTEYLDLDADGRYRFWDRHRTDPGMGKVRERGRWKLAGRRRPELCFEAEGGPARAGYDECGHVGLEVDAAGCRVLHWSPTTRQFAEFGFRGLATRPALLLDPGSGRLSREGGDALFAFEVDQPVMLEGGAAAPVYPPALDSAGVTGRSLLRFVVDTTGRPDTASVVALGATHPAFAAAASDAVRGYRFAPATLGGRRVPQVVDLPFGFGPLYPDLPADAAGPPLHEDAVDVKADIVPKSAMPRYPQRLLDAHVEAVVVVRMIVDTAGMVEPASFTVVRATHPGFVPAVRAWVPLARFTPAEKHGRKVRQVVQQPFRFYLKPAR